MSHPNKKIEHVTLINAPVDKVWKALIDINDWSWNKWTRLEAEEAPVEGVKGKLKACYEGNDDDDDEWETFDFTFGKVDPDTFTLSWFGSIGPCGCIFEGYHTMRLEVVVEDDKHHEGGGEGSAPSTRLIHTERFSGMLPALGIGLPYKILDRNYLLMNESLKDFVEGKK